MIDQLSRRRTGYGAEPNGDDPLRWRTQRGKDLKIVTIGIVSARNEAGHQFCKTENDRRDEHLRHDLADYEPHQVRGRYGRVDKPLLSIVHPFVAANVTKETIVALGAKYHQFHVIFGAQEGGGEESAFRFELLEADGTTRVVAVRKLFANEHKARLYLEAGFPDDGGRFFLIPIRYEQNPF